MTINTHNTDFTLGLDRVVFKKKQKIGMNSGGQYTDEFIISIFKDMYMNRQPKRR